MALGHWLKDYLGPKASGEGGGGSVEVIKIATAYGGAGTTGFFTGGGQMLDTLGNLIGDKKIIGFVAEVESSTSGTNKIASVNVVVYNSDETAVINPIIHRDEALSKNLCNVFGVVDSLSSGKPLEVYAICI